MRILVVDDSRFMRKYIIKMLREAGYVDFVEAENGQKAIEMYKLCNPSLVVMDLNMPELDGLSALKQIKNINSIARVIMCTSMGGQKLITDELIEHGAHQIVEKPYFMDLIFTVNNLKVKQAKELLKARSV